MHTHIVHHRYVVSGPHTGELACLHPAAAGDNHASLAHARPPGGAHPLVPGDEEVDLTRDGSEMQGVDDATFKC